MSWRAIPFDEGRHLGTLYHRPPSDIWGGGSDWWPLDSSREVRGPVHVPENEQVRLWASQKADKLWERIPGRFEGLRHLAADDLDSLAVLSPDPGWAADIAHLTGLSELIAGGWGLLSDQEFRSLLSLQCLIGLDVGYSDISSPRLVRMIEVNPLLGFVDAGACSGGDEVAAALAERSGLKKLNLRDSDLTDAGLAHLAGLVELRELSLADCSITERGAAALAELGELRSLDLEGTALADGVAPIIGRLQQLEQLTLGKTRIGDATVAALACESLRYINLADTAVTGATLDPDVLVRLEQLLITDTQLTIQGMKRVAALPALKTLMLWDVPMSDEAMAALNGHPTLEHVDLSGCTVSPGALLRLIESLPKLRKIRRTFEQYQTPEQIAGYVAELQTIPPGAVTIDPDDLIPDPDVARSLEGTWVDLGASVSDRQRMPRAIANGPLDRVWIGCRDHSGSSGRDRATPEWQRRGWAPPKEGPVALANVGGAFAFGPDGRLWVGDRDLWSVGRKARRELPAGRGFLSDISFDRSGRTWVVRNYDEVWRKTRRRWDKVEVPDLPDNTGMKAIACHPDGSVWIAASAGLLRWENGTWTLWKGPADGLPESYEWDAWAPSPTTAMDAVMVTPDGTVWASGGTGVVRYRNGEFTLWDHRDGLWPWRHLVADPVTRDVYGIGHGHIGRFDGRSWAVAPVPETYGSGGVSHATMHDGALAVLTGKGRLLRFEPIDSEERPAVRPSQSLRRPWTGSR